MNPVLLLDPADNVLVATADLVAGQEVADGGQIILMSEAVPLGHKLARWPIPVGTRIVKYGAAIGSSTCNIAAGAWVHVHNLASDYLATPPRATP
jgi:altronate dehydratase